MSLAETLSWPFFNDGHRAYAEKLSRWAADNLHTLPHDDVDEACRARVKALGEAGFLTPTVPGEFGGMYPTLDACHPLPAKAGRGKKEGSPCH